MGKYPKHNLEQNPDQSTILERNPDYHPIPGENPNRTEHQIRRKLKTEVTKPFPEQNPDIQTQYLNKTQIPNQVLTTQKSTQITEQDVLLPSTFLGE